MSDDLFDITGRIVLITGASSGIGAYLAQGLAARGAARVYAVGRREAQLAAVAAASPAIRPLVGDVSTIAGCKAVRDAFVEAEARAGMAREGVRLDLLVNNAGVKVEEGEWGADAAVEEVAERLLAASDASWAREFATNVGSVQVRLCCSSPLLSARPRTAAHTEDGAVDDGVRAPAARAGGAGGRGARLRGGEHVRVRVPAQGAGDAVRGEQGGRAQRRAEPRDAPHAARRAREQHRARERAVRDERPARPAQLRRAPRGRHPRGPRWRAGGRRRGGRVPCVPRGQLRERVGGQGRWWNRYDFMKEREREACGPCLAGEEDEWTDGIRRSQSSWDRMINGPAL